MSALFASPTSAKQSSLVTQNAALGHAQNHVINDSKKFNSGMKLNELDFRRESDGLIMRKK